jgi:arginine deiminase
VQFQIDSEYDRLTAVLVHRPGGEIDRLTHENCKRFLFEDVPYLRRLQEEHDAFVAKMRDNDVEVFVLGDLLKDVLADEGVRSRLIGRVCEAAAIPAIADELTSLKHWDIPQLAELLFAGVTVPEYMKTTGQRIADDRGDDAFLLTPVPNAYFSRDPAVVVRNTAISSKMHYRERVRETLIVRCVLENHPDFRENSIVYGGSDDPTEDRPYTVEGGDIIVLSKDAILIGASERTRSETIERLAGKCFEAGQIKRVYEIPIPSERAFMHLDTVFTVVDHGKVLWYGDVMDGIKYIHRYEPGDEVGVARRLPEPRGFVDILQAEFGRDVTVINTAGGVRPHAAKEQRMDGANALALAPSVVFTYERNEHTTRELEEHGVQCIVIDDAELVRGLGGPRCMTMPLRRER